MKPTGNQVLVGLIVVAVGVWVVRQGRMHGPERGGPGTSEIEYQGQHFKLTKTYDDFEDFNEDPDALDPSENARAEQAVTEAKVAKNYRNRMQLMLDVVKLQFPGYGLRHFGEKPQPDGTGLTAFGIEIPRTDKYRLLVFRGRKGRYTLVDDFVTEFDPLSTTKVRVEDGQLQFCTRDGKTVISRPLGNP